MPQLFPMNWICLSILFSLLLSFSLINLYFFLMKTKKLLPNFIKINKFLLKW
uniref:ATP synthase F0 subunit 8 n=1 Tax=Ixodes persulcatus TaxID=34615 RepID=Q8HQI8_IXOPE|nr:ATP synthase F0 subunit 8 [Ixodes persulcatus]ANG08302.1 ATP synthase F0 subunit 8 [Ixodes persulcatus]UNO53744.1 ATP synthase F0 subunit 8 [Ixodes persulcatus]UNO53757.1 ATP synthase F0 subunit 8 [Ixodes persulcatus]UXX50331.1 ATP synthase subunit 8 [Ixodes persulcatus]BAC22599.1 ATPase subunit 8 [Ixodes persulcatus]